MTSAVEAWPAVRIEDMVCDDVRDVHTLISGSFEARLRPYMTAAQPGAARFLEAYVRTAAFNPDRRYRVARSDSGQLLGFADLRLIGDTSCFLSYIAVSRAARGRGVASAILDDFLSEHPYLRSMELDVFADNVAARALYEKRGFRETGAVEWWVREVPPKSAVPSGWVLKNAPEAAAWHFSFGFCNYLVDTGSSTRNVGHIGSRTLRCYSAGDFTDRDFLAGMAALVPAAREALFIGPSSIGVRLSGCSSVNTSIRMTCPLVAE